MSIQKILEQNYQVGDTAWEYLGYGAMAQITFVTVPVYDEKLFTLTWKATVGTMENPEETSYLITKGFEHYGARLYASALAPAYGAWEDVPTSVKTFK